MKMWSRKHPHAITAWGVWMMAILAAGIAMAEPANTPDTIHIVADQLVTQTQNRSAEFIGNVKVEQGKTTITADRLKLIYKGGSSSAENVNTESIDSIEAIGSVRITMDDRIAQGQRAVYTTAEKKLVLFGPGAKVINGPDVIEGSLITFYRENGRVEMIGDEKNPVKATIRSNQRGLN